MEQKTKKLAKICVWMITGILVCISASCMKTGNSFNFDQYLTNHDVYNFSKAEIKASTNSCVYNSSTDTFMVNGSLANKTFEKIIDNKPWPFISLNVSNLNVESSNWKILYYNANGVELTEQMVKITNGENVIENYYKEPFQRMVIAISDQPNLTFTLNSVQLRDSATPLDVQALTWQAINYFVIYLFVSLLIWFLRKGNPYGLVELLQYAFILFGDYLGSKIGGKLSSIVRNRLRTLLFFILYIFMTYWSVKGFYQQQENYKYGILISVIILILIGLISWERPLQYVRWNGIIQVTWLVMWVMVCLSDFVVSKFYKFTGYAFLFGVGFSFFVWNNMERPKWIRNNMIRALEWTFPVCMVFCILFRQKRAFLLYNGPFLSRENMAAYALVTLLVFLADIYFCLLHRRVALRKFKIVLYGMGAAVSVYYLYISYTFICILAAVVVTLMFAIFLFQRKHILALGISGSIGMLCVTAVCAVVIVLAFHTALKNLPEHVGKNLEYANNRIETRIDPATLENLQGADPQYWNGVQSTTAMDKGQVWTQYLGRMNLFGHDNMLYYERQQTMACNGMLEMAYRYGIFTLVPYTLLLLSCLYLAWKERGYLMLAITVAFGIVMMTQNIEMPFVQPLWIVFYLGMGGWFVTEQEKREVTMHETDSNRTLLQ